MDLFFDKTKFINGCALSCVENYLLYLLNINEIKYDYLFYKSYKSFDEIMYDFFINKMEYAFYKGISRLQDVASDLGLCKLMEYDTNDPDIILNDERVVAICVKSDFIEKKYGRSLWRDDHFILINKNIKSEYQYLNDNPLDVGYFSKLELYEIYNGIIICFGIDINNFKYINKFELLENLYEAVQDSRSYNLDVFLENNIDILCLRDMLGVLRVIIKRMQIFCSEFIDDSFLIEYSKMIDLYYSRLEYMRLRKSDNLHEIKKVIIDVSMLDKKVRAQLIEKIGGFIYEYRSRNIKSY